MRVSLSRLVSQCEAVLCAETGTEHLIGLVRVDDDFSLSIFNLKTLKSFSNLAQRVTFINHRDDLHGLKEYFHKDQILLVLDKRYDIRFLHPCL
jgi:hypothetical protein